MLRKYHAQMKLEDTLHHRFRGGDSDIHASIMHRVAGILRQKIRHCILHGHSIRPLTVTLDLDKTTLYHVLARPEYKHELSFLVNLILHKDDGMHISIFHVREGYPCEKSLRAKNNKMTPWHSFLSSLYRKMYGMRTIFFVTVA